MNRKLTYTPPRLMPGLALELDSRILGGSVVDKVEGVQAIQQEVVTQDFSDASTFNHSWEGD